MNITQDIYNVGVNDYRHGLFEKQYGVHSMAYNSYLIMDEKIAVLDSVDKECSRFWLENLREVLGSDQPDYLIIQHMEPDHSGSIMDFLRAYPGTQLIATKQAFTMLKQFYGTEYQSNRRIVTEGDTLDLGRHKLTFYTAPMVHWPEVMVSYDSTDKVLFSADGFGKFGSTDAEETWACEARRYYFGIVGMYGAQVQALLKKAATLDIQIICPLHGPVLTEDIGYYIEKYDTWSSYRPEDKGVCIAFTSVYGNTRAAAEYLGEKLEEAGVMVTCMPLIAGDNSELVEDAFRFTHTVLCTTTYNGSIFPPMRDYISHLTERRFQGRTIALIENGSWAPRAAKVMKDLLAECPNLTYLPGVTIRSALDEESQAQLDALLEELLKGK